MTTDDFNPDEGEARLPGPQVAEPSMPVPRVTSEQFLRLRQLKAKQSINDQIEPLVVMLIENETFLKYVDAVYDSEAVEGSLDANAYMAALMIRNLAVEQRLTAISSLKLETIVHSYRVILRRYGWSPKQRRLTVGGQFVPEPPAE